MLRICWLRWLQLEPNLSSTSSRMFGHWNNLAHLQTTVVKVVAGMTLTRCWCPDYTRMRSASVWHLILISSISMTSLQDILDVTFWAIGSMNLLPILILNSLLQVLFNPNGLWKVNILMPCSITGLRVITMSVQIVIQSSKSACSMIMKALGPKPDISSFPFNPFEEFRFLDRKVWTDPDLNRSPHMSWLWPRTMALTDWFLWWFQCTHELHWRGCGNNSHLSLIDWDCLGAFFRKSPLRFRDILSVWRCPKMQADHPYIILQMYS